MELEVGSRRAQSIHGIITHPQETEVRDKTPYLLAETPNGDARLLAAHDKIGMMLGHGWLSMWWWSGVGRGIGVGVRVVVIS